MDGTRPGDLAFGVARKGRYSEYRRRVGDDGLARSAAASRTCSQLSITNSRTLPSSAAATLSLMFLPGCWVMPSTAATASGSATAASSKTQTPSGNSSASRATTSVASRVLPTPPTPVMRILATSREGLGVADEQVWPGRCQLGWGSAGSGRAVPTAKRCSHKPAVTWGLAADP